MTQINFIDSIYGSEISTVEIQKVLEQIQKGYWKNKIEEFRYHINNGNKSKAGGIKNGLPAFTIYATFRGGRKKEHFESVRVRPFCSISGTLKLSFSNRTAPLLAVMAVPAAFFKFIIYGN